MLNYSSTAHYFPPLHFCSVWSWHVGLMFNSPSQNSLCKKDHYLPLDMILLSFHNLFTQYKLKTFKNQYSKCILSLYSQFIQFIMNYKSYFSKNKKDRDGEWETGRGWEKMKGIKKQKVIERETGRETDDGAQKRQWQRWRKRGTAWEADRKQGENKKTKNWQRDKQRNSPTNRKTERDILIGVKKKTIPHVLQTSVFWIFSRLH